jgi:hypothetical protein
MPRMRVFSMRCSLQTDRIGFRVIGGFAIAPATGSDDDQGMNVKCSLLRKLARSPHPPTPQPSRAAAGADPGQLHFSGLSLARAVLGVVSRFPRVDPRRIRAATALSDDREEADVPPRHASRAGPPAWRAVPPAQAGAPPKGQRRAAARRSRARNAGHGIGAAGAAERLERKATRATRERALEAIGRGRREAGSDRAPEERARAHSGRRPPCGASGSGRRTSHSKKKPATAR